MKSPIMRAAAKPLVEIDARLWREFLAARAAYDKLSAEEKNNKPPPRRVRLRLEDTTIEAAQDAMRDNPKGMLCLQDELSGWFGGMDKYNAGGGARKDRGFWLQTWNGGSLPVDRVGRGSFLIENIGASVLGGVQPDVIRKVAGETYDDGLIQRLLPILLREATLGRDVPMPGVVEDYAELIERLHQLTPGSINADVYSALARDAGVRLTLAFDNEAQMIRQDLEKKHLELQQVINKKLAAHVGKYNGYFARLCTVWHCIEHASGGLPVHIGADTAERVAEFMHKFLFPHAVAFYAGILGLAADHDRLSAVAGYILAHKLERISSRDVQRGDRTMRKLTKRDTDAVFQQLEALGWVKCIPRRNAADLWIVNKQVHDMFTERAEREAARRGEVRRVMLGLGATAFR
jgi:Protein of unknown function (DUF3987)